MGFRSWSVYRGDADTKTQQGVENSVTTDMRRQMMTTQWSLWFAWAVSVDPALMHLDTELFNLGQTLTLSAGHHSNALNIYPELSMTR